MNATIGQQLDGCVGARFRLFGGGMGSARSNLGYLVLLVVACEKGNAAPPSISTSSEPQAAPAAPSASSATAAPSASAAADTAALRRTYRVGDLRFDECAKADDAGVVHGRKCAAVFDVFGPYANVPPKSLVQVSFKVKATSPAVVVSDVVSDMGRVLHVNLLDQPIAANEERQVGYRVSLPQGATGLEARIGVHAPGPVDFEIKDLAVEVQ